MLYKLHCNLVWIYLVFKWSYLSSLGILYYVFRTILLLNQNLYYFILFIIFPLIIIKIKIINWKIGSWVSNIWKANSNITVNYKRYPLCIEVIMALKIFTFWNIYGEMFNKKHKSKNQHMRNHLIYKRINLHSKTKHFEKGNCCGLKSILYFLQAKI